MPDGATDAVVEARGFEEGLSVASARSTELGARILALGRRRGSGGGARGPRRRDRAGWPYAHRPESAKTSLAQKLTAQGADHLPSDGTGQPNPLDRIGGRCPGRPFSSAARSTRSERCRVAMVNGEV